MPSLAPAFWRHGTDSRWPQILRPAAALYELGNRVTRSLAGPPRGDLPVLSVGNLVAGGAGKTPTAIALARHLAALGQNPHIVCRGYGGRLGGPLRVDPARHRAADVGDEALLIAQALPTWIGRDRPATARAALAAGASCIVADDAHQTWALPRRLSVLVIDAGYGFGNGMVLPAGPLREPVDEGLARTDAVILIGRERAIPLPDFGARPVFAAVLEPNSADVVRLRGRRVFAFAGIGRPEKFYATLEECGALIVGRRDFPDHAPYNEDTVMRLVEAAHALNAVPVTTAKDQMRLPVTALRMIDVLRVSLRFAAADKLDALLRSKFVNV